MTEQDPLRLSDAQLECSSRGLVADGVFEQAVHKTRMPMVITDPRLPDCPLVFVNPAFSEMTGYDPGSVLGRNCRFLQGPETDPEAVRRIRLGIEQRTPVNQELYNYRRDGSGFWTALFISPIFDEAGRLTYFFASHVDVSARREALRRQTQRIESMGALASGVAHEFNNLMTVVLGSIERAAMRAVDDAQRRQLERADWGAQRAGKMAGELLSLARRQAHESRTCDLNQSLADLEETMTRIVPDTIKVGVQISAAPAMVRLDPEQLRMVLINLIRNAVDAMPDGGRVTLSVRVLSQREAAASLGSRTAVELLVSDTGTGMPPEVTARATELFFSTKSNSRGSGLGLFLALEFVDKCGGRLALDSQPGQGTRVALVFPQVS